MQAVLSLKDRFIQFIEGRSRSEKKGQRVRSLIHMWNFPILFMGLLLGRAMIMGSVSPFAVAYLAVVFHLSKKQWPMTMVFLTLGALTVDPLHGAYIFGFLSIFLCVQKGFSWIGKRQISYAPVAVLISSSLGHGITMAFQPFTLYQSLLAAVDIVLSLILTYIFVQSVPIFTVKRRRLALRTEEIICLGILVGAVMTGSFGWFIGDLSVVNMISRFLILSLALVGGAMLGSSMGVVTGIIISLSNTKSMMEVSLLALSGLLAGLFKEGKRIGVGVGFLLGTAILSLYHQQAEAMWISLQESLLAVLAFMIVPQKWFQLIGRYIPGTSENKAAQLDYIKRLRDVTAAKVEQFTELFQELAFSFREDIGKVRRENEEHVHQFVADVIQLSCTGCSKYSHCWEQNVMRTYQGMTDLMAHIESEGITKPITTVPRFWSEQCIRDNKVANVIQDQYLHLEEMAFWKDKMKDSRRLVSEQLTGMAEVMNKLAGEIRHETQVLSGQEEQIHESLEELGLSIQRIDVINLEEGKVEIEVVMPHRDGLDECKKLIAPLLTEVLGEPISVFRKEIKDRSLGAVITLGSAQRYELKTGVATAAKGGGFVSGDSYCYMNLGTGKYAVAISDGMGNGGRAQDESHAALRLLRRLLQAGMNEERTVEMVNSILSLRSSDEMFATIDLALVDLNTARARFMKIGSTPGFIKRGKEVILLNASNLPIGILNEIDIEPIEMQLMPGDLIILFTDGIYDAPRHSIDKDALLTRLISEIETKDPQDFADCLLERVVRYYEGYVEDDMTVVISKVEKHAPEWSTIRLPGTVRLQRPQPAL